MIVICTYYSDGSATPELQFYPDGERQAADIAAALSSGFDTGKSVLAYEITDLAKSPMMVYPRDERLII